MFKIVTVILALALSSLALALTNNDGAAFVIDRGDEIVLGNGLFNVTYNESAIATSVYKNGVDLIENVHRAWYFDGTGGSTVANRSIVTDSPDEVHVVFVREATTKSFYAEFHLVVLRNVSGIYQYVRLANPNDVVTVDRPEVRTVYIFNHKLMPKLTNIVRSGETPDIKDRPTIQDTTWQLPDGTYYSKYDYCGYIRETPWFGVYGGGFGAWIISASREYHSGGPLKQELLVHQNSLMLNYFTSTHFGTPNLLGPPGWSKFYGPFLVYLNTGTDEEVTADAARQADLERQQWPYKWVQDEAYPLSRASVSGKVTGQLRAMVVLYDSLDEQFDLQTLGYLYNTETNENGTFTIENVRPGKYRIAAYPLAGQGSENLPNVTVHLLAGDHQDVGTLDLPEPSDVIWAIGETNRRSDSYRYSDELRNFYWHLLPPSELTFVIGESRLDKQWYYAQKEGVWKIAYRDRPDGADRELRVAIAAATGSLIFNVTTIHLQVDLNGDTIANFQYENDKAVYRDALQSGNFYVEKLTISADRVADGDNVVALKVLQGSVMYDAISLAKKVSSQSKECNF